jgi:hypothetical protein
MNMMQRLVLLVGAVFVVGMGVYPPWVYTTEVCIPALSSGRGGEPIRKSEPAGYFLIYSPPESSKDQGRIELKGVKLDTERLAIQECVVVIAAIMGVLFFKKTKPAT